MPVTTRIVIAAPAGYETPLLAIAVPEAEFPESLTALDRQLGGALRRLFQVRDFRGRRDETSVFYPDGPAARVALIGLGKVGDDPRAGPRRAAAVAGKLAQKLGVATAAFHVVPEAGGEPADLAQAVAEGIVAGAWRYLALKRPPEEPLTELERVDLLFPEAEAGAEAGWRRGAAIAAGHALARDLQILPGNLCTPSDLGSFAEELGRRHGFEVTVLDRSAIEREELNALLAVGQGSAQEPRFIALEYRGSEVAPTVLVGKGVTFDTGGISIKQAERMEDMKFDMSGAAAVLGVFEMLGRLRPSLHVVGLIPSVENMPSGKAYKPGDVVRGHLGKTIEVVNTDAEGRLLLADALSYARRYSPAEAIDAATLTGAVVIALGHTAAAVLGTDPVLVRNLVAAGDRAGERLWELPLWDDYRDLIKSDIADVKNSGGRAAGTITAAWFLKEFVDGFPWAHLDIAGTAYSDRENPAMAKGPTGIGVRLLSEFLLAQR